MPLILRMNQQREKNTGGKPMQKDLRQLEIEELYHLSAQIESNPRRVAALLFPDQPADRFSLTEAIGQWAVNQAVVLESNLNGKPDVAVVFSKVGNRIWQRLPKSAQSVQVRIE
jgi:hypothetical protein